MDKYVILTAVVAAILLMVAVYFLTLFINKFRPHSGKTWFAMTPLPASIRLPAFRMSEYAGMDANSMRYDRDRLGMWPTVDDPYMQALAKAFADQYGKKPKAKQAKILLAIVQQNIRYVHDDNNYGIEEFWALPAMTIVKGSGDCEDSAFIYAGLAYLIGLDVILIHLMDHMTCGVCVPEPFLHNRVYTYNGRKYYDADTVRIIARIGRGSSAGQWSLSEVKEPDERFKAAMRPIGGMK